jgi:hypothetical protein
MARRMSARSAVIGFQFAEEAFGKAAADQQAVAGGQPGVLQGIEEHGFGAGGGQCIQVVGVVEAEGGVAGDGDAYRRSRYCARRGGGGASVGVAEGQQAIEVDLRGDALADGGDVAFGLGGFVGRHQAQVALDQGQFGILLHRADHRHVGVVLDHGAQLGFVAAAAEAVEDHAGDADAVRSKAW